MLVKRTVYKRRVVMAELANSGRYSDGFSLAGDEEEAYNSSEEPSYYRSGNNGRGRAAEVSPAVPHSTPTLLGQEWLIHRHEVDFSESDVLGYGGCACIVRGTYRRSQPVAVKLLPPDMLTETAAKLLEREAYILSLVSRPRHPNIVKFVGAWLSPGGTYGVTGSPLLVTELLDTDLRELRAKLHLNKCAMLGIFLDVSYGLCYLHEQPQPIIHRDINPSNILMKRVGSTHWRAKIGDFGSANLTSHGTVCSLGGGTDLYSAPETLPSTLCQPPVEGITVKADIYSYGVTVLEVVTDTLPESGSFKSHVKRLYSKWPDMHSLVEQCMEAIPRDRPTASQVVDLLEQTSAKERV